MSNERIFLSSYDDIKYRWSRSLYEDMIATTPVVTELRLISRSDGELVWDLDLLADVEPPLLLDDMLPSESDDSSIGVAGGDVSMENNVTSPPDSRFLPWRNSIAANRASSKPYTLELNVLLRLVFPSIQNANQAFIRRFHDTPRQPERY